MEKNCLPTGEYILSDITEYRERLVKLHAQLHEWGRYTKRLLGNLIEKDQPPIRDSMNTLQERHAQWHKHLLMEYDYYGQMKTFGNIRTCPSVQVFVELSRTHFLIMYSQIKDLTSASLQKGSPQGILAYSMLQTEYFDGDFDLPWEKPIMNYTQQEIMNGLLMITEKLDQLPTDSFGEVDHICNLLYTRNSVFMCEESVPELLNVVNMRVQVGDSDLWTPNRDYMTFCSIYFHVIWRRIFYHGAVVKNNHFDHLPEGSVDRAREWLEDVADGLGSEGFEDLFTQSCEEAYRFPGDTEWFRYRNPDMPVQTGPILDCFRKKFSKRYFSEYRTSKETVFAAADQNSHSGHCARIFLFNCVDQYMRTQFTVPWKDGFLVSNDVIEVSEIKLVRNHAPYLLQLYSRFWVYAKGKIIARDNIFELLAIWFYICKLQFGSKLFGIDISPIVDRVVDNVRKKPFSAGF